MSQPPTRNSARSGEKNQFYHGNFEYHVCLQVDAEHGSWKDDVVVLRTSEDDAYEQVIAIDDDEWTQEETIEGVRFRVIRFTGVKIRKYYDCYVASEAEGRIQPSFYVFRRRFLERTEAGEGCELDVLEE